MRGVGVKRVKEKATIKINGTKIELREQVSTASSC